MTDSEKKTTIIIVGIVTVVVAVILFFVLTPTGRKEWNNTMYELHKVDDATLYSTRKQVEDTCRSMMSSYTSDSMIYNQYKESDNAEKQGWAEQAKMRANKTAASYNEYVLKNSFVWQGNIPADIKNSLDYLK